MAIYQWTLLGFAGWTLAILLLGIGVSRWSLILRGHAKLTDFPADQAHGSPRYRRIVRAHANCVENLPVYAAIVVVASLAEVRTVEMDVLALCVLAGRVGQTLVHIAFTETSGAVAFRFSFFSVQLGAMLAMGGLTVIAGCAR